MDGWLDGWNGTNRTFFYESMYQLNLFSFFFGVTAKKNDHRFTTYRII